MKFKMNQYTIEVDKLIVGRKNIKEGELVAISRSGKITLFKKGAHEGPLGMAGTFLRRGRECQIYPGPVICDPLIRDFLDMVQRDVTYLYGDKDE